jgi:hypothetical protein
MIPRSLPPTGSLPRYSTFYVDASDVAERLEQGLPSCCTLVACTPHAILTRSVRVRVAPEVCARAPFLAVVLRSATNPRVFCYWGLFPAALALAHQGRPFDLSAFECRERPWREASNEEISDEDVRFAVRKRANAYKHRLTHLTSDGKSDRAGFEATLRCVAAFDGVDRGVMVPSMRLRGRWIHAECRMAAYRFAWHPRLMLRLVPELRVDGDAFGLPFELAPSLAPLSLQYGVGRMEAGTLWMPPHLFVAPVVRMLPALLDRLLDATLEAGQQLLRGHDEFCRWVLASIRSQLAPPLIVDAAPSDTLSLGIRVQHPAADIEDLQRHMPACMKPLAQLAFDPADGRHLDFNQRRIFYNFALANGLSKDTLAEEMGAKMVARKGLKEGSEYTRTTIHKELASIAQFVQTRFAEDASYGGPGCRSIQSSGLCPFAQPPGHARVACLKQMLNVPASHRLDFTKLPVRSSPLIYAQLARSGKNIQPHHSASPPQQHQQQSIVLEPMTWDVPLPDAPPMPPTPPLRSSEPVLYNEWML